MRDRDYQVAAEDCVFREWDRGVRGTLVSHATGLGKTVLAGRIARRIVQQSRLLFVVHREELMFQAAKALGSMAKCEVVREGAGYKELLLNPKAPIVVGMIQSLRRRMRTMDADLFSHVIIDEAHHATADGYRRAVDHFKGAKHLLGLTATPKRADGQAMGAVFDSVAHEMTVSDGIDLGWLTPMRSRIVTCNDLDLRNINLNAGEYNQRELKEQLLKQAVVDRIARRSIEIADGRQTVIFCQNIEQSQAVKRVICTLGGNAVHIDGKLPKSSRRHRIDQFAEARVQFLCNCAVVEEGVDVPGIEVVANARPTRSQTRIIQSVGRGMRPVDPPIGDTAEVRRAEISGSAKPYCTVIDFVGQIGARSMCFSGDLLGGDYDDDVRREAVEIAKQYTGDVDWREVYREAIAVASQRSVKQKSLGGSRSQERRWCAKYRPCPYDVLDLRLEDARSVSKDDCNGGNLDSAIAFLEGEKLQSWEFNRLANYEQVFLARHIRRRSWDGLCSYPQARVIHKFGYSSDQTGREASLIIDRVKKANWVRPFEDGPNEVYEKACGRT